MMYNSKLVLHLGKLMLRYFDPFQIVEVLGQGTFKLMDLHGNLFEKPPFLVKIN